MCKKLNIYGHTKIPWQLYPFESPLLNNKEIYEMFVSKTNWNKYEEREKKKVKDYDLVQYNTLTQYKFHGYNDNTTTVENQRSWIDRYDQSRLK